MTQRLSDGHGQFKANLRLAKQLWPNQIQELQVRALKALSSRYLFSVAAGDLQYLEGRWYVTHAGLLGLAILVAPVHPRRADLGEERKSNAGPHGHQGRDVQA